MTYRCSNVKHFRLKEKDKYLRDRSVHLSKYFRIGVCETVCTGMAVIDGGLPQCTVLLYNSYLAYSLSNSDTSKFMREAAPPAVPVIRGNILHPFCWGRIFGLCKAWQV